MADEKVFVPHLTECWAPATKSGTDTYKLIEPLDFATTDDLKTVKLDESAWKKLQALPNLSTLPPFKDAREALPPIVDPLEGKDNIAELQFVSEASVMHAIRARYNKKTIYTDVGRIVVALNPFQSRPDLYNDAAILRYAQSPQPFSLVPHIYQIAAGAHKGVSEDGLNQSTLITGESGAGKTESTKLLLRFFAFLGGHLGQSKQHGGSGKASIEDRIIMANPILEAFGNASTARNPNSSRFGKYIEMLFDPSMRIKGATITSYMLEMPRVCEHQASDRNYHVFYQVVENKLGGIKANKNFKYIIPQPVPQGQTMKGHGIKVNDAEMYKEILQSFKDYEFTSNEQTNIFNLVACVLYLGNLEFDEANIKGGEGSSLKGNCSDDLNQAASLLGVDIEILRNCLVSRKISTGKETMEVPLKPHEAIGARNGLSKLIYGSLFNWLLSRINEGLIPAAGTFKTIGVLDIAGFERFEINSLEQLLINLSNEKLQQQFNNDMILAELEDYKKEGVSLLKLDFNDNVDVLALIEGKGGLMDILDEELFVPKGSDDGYTAKTIKAHNSAKRFIGPKFSGSPTYSVNHFAGIVIYTTTGWLEKNKLAPPREALDVLHSAHNNVVKQMIKLIVTDTKKSTVCGNFKKQLSELITKIKSTQTNYVRCVKPNSSHKPGEIESHELLRQLKYAGIMEAIKIRKSGFSLRITFADFVDRYAILIGADKPRDKNTAQEIINLTKSKGLKFNDQDIVMGINKVLAKETVRVTLDNMRIEAVEDMKRPLLVYIEAYEKACKTQDGMFLWPDPLLDADTPIALENQLKILEGCLEEVKKKLGSFENSPGWVGAAIIARDTMKKEVSVTIAANSILGKVKPLCCDVKMRKELEDVKNQGLTFGIKSASLEKVNQILALLMEEEDWTSQLLASDTDLESLVREIDNQKRDLLSPACHTALAEAKALLTKTANAAAAAKKAEREVKENMAKPTQTDDPAYLKSDSKTLADDILSQIQPKAPPPAKAGGAKADIARTIAKRPAAPKAGRQR